MRPGPFEQALFPHPKEAPHEIWHLSLVVIEGKKSFNNIEAEIFGPRSMNDLDLWYS